MDPIVDLYDRVRAKFPVISATADVFHQERWDDLLDVGAEFAWFESLADALNEEMRTGVPYESHAGLLSYLAGAYATGTLAVQQCIDVSFVENLFWRVPGDRCTPYWKKLPLEIKQLYLAFHHREP